MCDVNGVYLITVPYNVPHDKIKSYIQYYLPENYHQRAENEKNPNQVYVDLVDYNDNYDFDGEEYSDYSEDNSDNDEDEYNSDEYNSDEYTIEENVCSAMFSEDEEVTDDDIMRSYEISMVTKH